MRGERDNNNKAMGILPKLSKGHMERAPGTPVVYRNPQCIAYKTNGWIVCCFGIVFPVVAFNAVLVFR